MKLKAGFLVVAMGALSLCISAALAQGAPQIVWEVPTPSALGNSIQGVGWAPGTVARVAVGSTDRWVRTRRASSGALVYSILQPHRSGGADQTVYSNDGAFLAVHNRSGGISYRVHRAVDGVFLGMLTATIDPNGIVRFAPDAQLVSAVGGDGTLSRWRISNFTVVRSVGSGYDRVTTTFNFSPDGVYQATASRGSITIQRRSSGAIVRILTGGTTQSVAPMAFTPDSTRLAAWASLPNETTLWRIADGVALRRFPNAASNEGVVALRFSPDGARLVTTGYLPFVDSDGLWQQKGVIRFWRVSDGVLRRTFDARTGIAVTSPIAWSPDATRFAYGTYEGTAVAAITPAP
ncbi:MAG TPA: WD40 repeat domain-containing protein [Lysobacter sp.]|jgi:WD40 repeat protein|nr:WD40 repeat domain-containing protein [Lysobacter sp.]